MSFSSELFLSQIKSSLWEIYQMAYIQMLRFSFPHKTWGPFSNKNQFYFEIIKKKKKQHYELVNIPNLLVSGQILTQKVNFCEQRDNNTTGNYQQILF